MPSRPNRSGPGSRDYIPLASLPPSSERETSQTSHQSRPSNTGEIAQRRSGHTTQSHFSHRISTAFARLFALLGQLAHSIPGSHLLRPRTTCLALVYLVLSVPIALFALALITYITPGSGLARPCLPFSISLLSTAAHNRLSCKAYTANSQGTVGYQTIGASRPYNTLGTTSTSKTRISMATSVPDGPTVNGNDKTLPLVEVNGHGELGKAGKLAGFLQSQKDAFLADLTAKNAKGWVVAMGNEAGDLDTLASSIAYAHLTSTFTSTRSVPLIITPSSLMNLRPENLLAFKSANIPLSCLLHPESLPIPTSDLAGLGVRFAIVDTNRLLPQFGPVDTPGLVQGVIDHHVDEGYHEDAEVKIVRVPTGSCSSLVTEYFKDQWKASLTPSSTDDTTAAEGIVPNELATLLLSAGLIDTHGLKAGGKATPTDYAAAAFLYPLTPWYKPTANVSAITSESISASVPPPLTVESDRLAEAKFNVSYLSTHDLLIRDYKEYDLPTASTSFPVLKVGLSTVPLGMKEWLEKEGGGWTTYLQAVDKFLVERQLDVEGVLTTFQNSRGKSRRELVLIVRVGGVLDDAAARRIVRELAEGLEADTVLALEPWVKKGWKRFLHRTKREGLDGKGRYGRIWKQGNAKATRKQVAPVVRDLIAKIA